MRAFNPFEGGPARKAPRVKNAVPGVVHRLLAASDPVEIEPPNAGGFVRAGSIGGQIVKYMEKNPGMASFTADDLARLAPWIYEPDQALRIAENSGFITRDPSASEIAYIPAPDNSSRVRIGANVRKILDRFRSRRPGYKMPRSEVAELTGIDRKQLSRTLINAVSRGILSVEMGTDQPYYMVVDRA